MESGLPVRPQESSPPPLMTASEWQCTDHWRSGNWLVICIDVKQQGTRTLPCGRPFSSLRHLLRLPTRSTKIRLFDSMFWMSSVSITYVLCYLKEFPYEEWSFALCRSDI